MSWDLIEKSGNPTNGGWDYNESNMNYDQDIDDDSMLSVLYNSLGATSTPFTNISKN